MTGYLSVVLVRVARVLSPALHQQAKVSFRVFLIAKSIKLVALFVTALAQIPILIARLIIKRRENIARMLATKFSLVQPVAQALHLVRRHHRR